MKPMKLIAGLMLAISLLIPITFTGCGTLPERPAQTIALDSLKSTYTVTRDAYKTGVRLWIAGKITDDQKANLDKTWNDFRAGLDLAVRSSGLDWANAPTSQNVLTLKDNLFKLLKSL